MGNNPEPKAFDGEDIFLCSLTKPQMMMGMVDGKFELKSRERSEKGRKRDGSSWRTQKG